MNKENTVKLASDFPELYRDVGKHPRETAMCWGFECADGWFDLIYKLSSDITTYCKENNIPVPVVLQVKEKFAGLRYYVGAADEHIYQLIEDACGLSYKTCEICGLPGKVVGQRWVSTRCEQHAEK